RVWRKIFISTNLIKFAVSLI
ncbi:hypothetical protein MOA74_16220, partial [Bacillus spizizenii]|nr:hypothetical protein [Bacillus spizizenii]